MRALTKADKERGKKLRDLGCIVCLKYLEVFTPPAIHHLDGQTKPGCHKLTIPLCEKHHQKKDNRKPPRWTSRHGDGKAEFEGYYGAESLLLIEVNGLINE